MVESVLHGNDAENIKYIIVISHAIIKKQL